MFHLIKLASRLILFFLAFIVLVYTALWTADLFVEEPPNEDINFGVTYSSFYADQLGLDPQETYLAILDDLNVKRIRIAAYWTDIEPVEGSYNFQNMDFQVREAEKRDADIILTVGRKLPRWPECHIPDWAKSRADQDQLLLAYITETVKRYKNSDAIIYWQVENEPFLKGFGDCPIHTNTQFLEQEIALVRSIDSRPILITDSGELGDWVRARRHGDIFGTTMYRTIWNDHIGKFQYPLPSTWFKFKDYVTRLFLGKSNYAKDVIVIEMQAEAWGEHPIPFITLEEQFFFMDFEEFKGNIVYSKRAGFPDIYLWGVEWWYYLMTTQDHPEFWQYAKTLF